MAIKRVIYELDDSTDMNPTTGASIQGGSIDKDFIKNQTKVLEEYNNSETSKSDESIKNKPVFGRTVSDLVAEFKNDSRVMTLIITIISFIIFVTKLNSVENFKYPIILSIILNLLWYCIPLIERKVFNK